MYKTYVTALIVIASIYAVKKIFTDLRAVYRAVKSNGIEKAYEFSQTGEIKQPKMPRYTNPAIYDKDYNQSK